MALPASDNFNRADASGAGALGANWTDIQGTFKIATNQVGGNGGAYNFVKWSADTFGNDHYAQVTIASGTNGGLGVRMSGTSGANANAYMIFITVGAAISLRKWVAGTETTITALGTPAANDVIKLQVSGTTIKVFINGTQTGTDQTDSSLASGSAGLVSFAAAALMDDFSADDIGGGGGGPVKGGLGLLGAGG